MADMVVVRKEGLYCVPGGFYIDPWRPVERAVITHAHGDHARAGHGHYLSSAAGVEILRAATPSSPSRPSGCRSTAGSRVYRAAGIAIHKVR